MRTERQIKDFQFRKFVERKQRRVRENSHFRNAGNGSETFAYDLVSWPKMTVHMEKSEDGKDICDE